MKKIPVFDGHNDTLTRLYSPEQESGKSFFEESVKGHIDLARAKKGGLAGGFFSICVPAPESSPEKDPYYGLTITEGGYQVKLPSPLEREYADDFFSSIVDFSYRLEKESSGKVKIARNYQEMERCIENDVLGMILHLEGAEPVKPDLSNLESFYQKGVRSLGLVWSRPNAFGHGVPFRYPHSPDTGPGLTEAGVGLVKACNELGIIIDLSHITEKGFRDVARHSKAPLVVSHTAVHSLCPSSRNLTDEQIDAVGKSGGIIGIIFVPTNLRLKTKADGTPDSDIPLTEIVKHIDYVVNRIGIDHVGFGSDFDGAEMPQELPDVSALPKLIDALREAGYSGYEIEKIACKNWLRVIKETWKRK